MGRGKLVWSGGQSCLSAVDADRRRERFQLEKVRTTERKSHSASRARRRDVGSYNPTGPPFQEVHILTLEQFTGPCMRKGWI